MLRSLALSLALGSPGVLSPEATAHNTAAMRFYDARQFSPAADEFHAAYRSMPDARRDRAGREQLLGSMHITLLKLYAETGDPAALCRLRSILDEHVDALAAAFPDDPDMRELQLVRARHTELSQQIADIDPEACEPPPPLLTAPPLSAPAATPAPPTPSPVALAAPTRDRKLVLAGSVAVPLGLVALGVVGGVAWNYRRGLSEADDLHTELTRRPCTDDDRERMRDLLAAAKRQEGAMIGLGILGGALVTTGTALLLRGILKRPGRARIGLDLRRNLAVLALSGEF